MCSAVPGASMRRAPSAVCSIEVLFWVLLMATVMPLVWAFRRVAICRPAASSMAELTFQIGASSSEKMTFDVTSNMTSLNAKLTGLSSNFAATSITNAAELTTGTNANGAIAKLEAAINDVSTLRSALGATANRLDHVNSNLSNIATNTKAATGRIMDTDFATESSNMTASQMLLQAGTAMLKQSNSMSSMVMSLLQ